MKYILIFALLLIFPALCMAQTAPVTLAWDAPDSTDLPNVKSTRIYDTLAGVSTKVAETACTLAVPNVCPNTATFSPIIGPHNWTARFYDGFQDSADSNTLSTPTKNPKNLRK